MTKPRGKGHLEFADARACTVVHPTLPTARGCVSRPLFPDTPKTPELGRRGPVFPEYGVAGNPDNEKSAELNLVRCYTRLAE